MSRLHGDDGSVTTELVIITPIAIALLCLVALVGRTSTAHEQVNEAARDAARSASFERDAGSAEDAAQMTAATSLDSGGFHCATKTVSVDTTAFYPGGQVAVTVQCEVSLSDLGLIALSGTRNVTSSAVSVVDLYKGSR